MYIEFFVEEESMEIALEILLPKIIGDVDFAIRTFDGKYDLLRELPRRLRGYQWKKTHDDWCIVVLIDEERQDCHELKQRLETIAHDAGYATRTTNPDTFHVINRIVIEELEAWFFGDVAALHAAYPRVDLKLGGKAPYRYPDTIKGGTKKALALVLKRDHPGGLEKKRAARE
ncbi:DUF4276 family protein, partial [Chloroflexota bacterium]